MTQTVMRAELDAYLCVLAGSGYWVTVAAAFAAAPRKSARTDLDLGFVPAVG